MNEVQLQIQATAPYVAFKLWERLFLSIPSEKRNKMTTAQQLALYNECHDAAHGIKKRD